MQDIFEYVRLDNEITIYRCYSYHSQIEIPEYIDGLPVTGLADHCFAAEASVRYRKEMILSTKDQAAADELTEKEIDTSAVPLVSTNITQLILPRQLKYIGNYAFYACHHLQQIRFPYTQFRLGSGIFVDCSHLQWLVFEAQCAQKPEGFLTPPCVREVLREIEYELETVFIDPHDNDRIFCRLYFPGYVEETIENTPARIIEMRYEGTGFKYRQCFQNGQIDFRQYDAHLYLMSVQENVSTSVPLTLDRLRTPVLLETQIKENYMDFLRREYRYLAQRLFSGTGELGGNDISNCYDAIMDLCDIGYFTEEILGEFVEMAGEKSLPQIVSLLMNYRREHFAKKKKSYAF